MKRASSFVISMLALCNAAVGAAAPDYAALTNLPRWEGPWNLGDIARRGGMQPPGPLRPEAAALLGKAAANELELDPHRWCGAASFAANNGGLADNVEFLFTPGQITIVTEIGLVRRIFTDGRSIPPDLPDSIGGLSIGRWENGTLLVETTRLSPDIPYHPLFGKIVTFGAGARISERIHLLDADHLEVQTTLLAPQILTAPERRRQVYTRAKPGYVPRQIDGCWGEDRSIDPVTGKQRFDLTPPADLPPPPR
jgi:hypothetical protein